MQKAQGRDKTEYLFHLTYPPKYYFYELEYNVANSEKYLKFPTRVTNFIFLENNLIVRSGANKKGFE